MDLEITNDSDENQVLLVLRTKLTFIWSNFQKFSEMREMYLKKSEKSKEMYEKTKKILDNLDKPFALMSIQLDNTSGNSNFLNWKTHPKEYETADKIENQIKSTMNLKSIKWLYLVKILLYILISISFINMYAKADFINMLIPVYILAMLSQSMSSKLLENMKLFIVFATLTLSTDILWLLFRDSVSKFIKFL